MGFKRAIVIVADKELTDRAPSCSHMDCRIQMQRDEGERRRYWKCGFLKAGLLQSPMIEECKKQMMYICKFVLLFLYILY